MKPKAEIEGYRFIKYIGDGCAIFYSKQDTMYEVWGARKNHSSYGFSYNNTDWEFVREATKQDTEYEVLHV